MAEAEAFTIKTLKEYRSIMSDHIPQHTGCVVDAPDDNILDEFVSAVEAENMLALMNREAQDVAE